MCVCTYINICVHMCMYIYIYMGVIYGCEVFIPSGFSSSMGVIHNFTLAFTHRALWNWFLLTADVLRQPLNRKNRNHSWIIFSEKGGASLLQSVAGVPQILAVLISGLIWTVQSKTHAMPVQQYCHRCRSGLDIAIAIYIRPSMFNFSHIYVKSIKNHKES